MIYFISAPDVNLVKIGRSNNPLQRVEAMQAHSPVPLVLLGYVDQPAQFEARLHTFLMAHHSHREWFLHDSFTREIIRHILAGTFDHARLPEKGSRSWAFERRRSNPLCPNGKPYARAA